MPSSNPTSVADSTEPGTLSPLVRAAAEGELPAWAEVHPERREHMGRVAALMGEWAERLALEPAERARWAAAGWLHDALRDAPADRLRATVAEGDRDLHPLLLHGPAAAERLRGEVDDEIRGAVRYHTIGHPSLGRLGRALYLADFLEPGRDFEVEWRAELSRRMPDEMDEVLILVLQARIRHLLEIRKPIRPETAAFWASAVAPR